MMYFVMAARMRVMDPNLSKVPVKDLQARILDIYESLDREIAAAAPVCKASGRCCRFAEYDHTLFLSHAEAELLTSVGLPQDSTINADTCPFQIDGLCTARERRPLGCRVYFCDPNYEGVGERLSEKYIARLKQAHQETETPWHYAPLVIHLRAYVEGGGGA